MSRISELPKRVWADDATPELIREMTDICRTPNGTMILRPAQAITLYEAAMLEGVYCLIRTGGGKTIVSGLLPFVLGAVKPILFVPAKLKQKTRKEFETLRKHWQIPGANYRIESFEKLGIAKYESLLTSYEPDLVVCDEAQMLKHLAISARARRMGRHMNYFPKTRFCAMTATPGEIDEFAHIVTWCLGKRAPVPSDPDDVAAWAGCLNNKVDDWARTNPEDLVPHLGKEAIDYPKAAFRERFIHTPGVIVSTDTFDGAGLIVKPRYVDPSPEVEAAFTDLRQVWEMPDGWSMADASFEVWHAARQLGLGYYYMHDPRPPEPWRDIRKQYCKFARTVLEHSTTYDTEKQVRDALEGGHILSPLYHPSAHVPADALAEHSISPDTITIYEAWLQIQDTYQPDVYPVWLSDHVIDSAINWGRAGGGIIWVDSVAFGTRLSEKTGWGYFRNFGYDQRKRFIESDRVTGKETIIASIESNKEGRNLQGKWNRNLIVDPPNKGDDWQQLVSRTHRDGQASKEVFVDYMITCYEYFNSIYAAVSSNESQNEMISQRYRLLDADVVMPTLAGRKGVKTWERSDKKNKLTVN